MTSPLSRLSCVALCAAVTSLPAHPALAAPAPAATSAAPETAPPAEGEAAAPAEGEAAAPVEGEAPPAEGEAAPPTETEEAAPAPEPEPEAAPPPPVVTGPERPEEPAFDGRPAKGTGLMIAGGTLMVAGIAGVITSAMMTTNCSYDGPLQCKYKAQDEVLIPLMSAPIALGLLLLGVGAGYRVRHNRWEAWTPEAQMRRDEAAKAKVERRRRGKKEPAKTALLPVASPLGAGLSFVGRF